MNNPEAIRFINEQIRPLAEKARALSAECQSMLTDWFGGLNATIGSSAQTQIEDGREAEGVSRLTAADVTNVVAQLQAIAELNAQVIAKPCVRNLAAS